MFCYEYVTPEILHEIAAKHMETIAEYIWFVVSVVLYNKVFA